MPSADQSRYQVRFEWGAEGLARLGPSDIVVVVDVLPPEPADAAGDAGGARPHGTSPDVAAIAATAAASGARALLGDLRNAAAVADAVLAEQARRGVRTSVAVIACGDREGADTGIRFAVEDHLGAGAIIDALGAIGIDHSSPEAAVAGEGFRGLRGAVRHLLSASVSAQGLRAAGRHDELARASVIDATTVVPLYRGGAFTV